MQPFNVACVVHYKPILKDSQLKLKTRAVGELYPGALFANIVNGNLGQYAVKNQK